MPSIIIIIGIIFFVGIISNTCSASFPFSISKTKTENDCCFYNEYTTDFQANEQKCISTISNNNKSSASSLNGYEKRKKKKKKWMLSLLSSVLRTWIGYILRIKFNAIDIMITFIRRVCYPYVSVSLWLFVSFVFIRIEFKNRDKLQANFCCFWIVGICLMELSYNVRIMKL